MAPRSLRRDRDGIILLQVCVPRLFAVAVPRYGRKHTHAHARARARARAAQHAKRRRDGGVLPSSPVTTYHTVTSRLSCSSSFISRNVQSSLATRKFARRSEICSSASRIATLTCLGGVGLVLFVSLLWVVVWFACVEGARVVAPSVSESLASTWRRHGTTEASFVAEGDPHAPRRAAKRQPNGGVAEGDPHAPRRAAKRPPPLRLGPSARWRCEVEAIRTTRAASRATRANRRSALPPPRLGHRVRARLARPALGAVEAEHARHRLARDVVREHLGQSAHIQFRV